MRVVVVGAGIAGLALAGHLQRAGHDVVVLEEAGQLRTGGAALAVWHNGATALRCLGTELAPHGKVIDAVEFWTQRGRRLGWIDAHRLSLRFGIDAVTIPRGELIAHLADQLDPGTVRFGTPGAAAREAGSGAVVELVGGEELAADLVVGADGHRSVVRHCFAPVVPARPTKWASLQGLTPAPLAITDGSTSVYAVGLAGSVGIMPAGRGLLQWWFDVPWPQATPPPSVVGWLRERFADWEGPVRDLLAVIADDEIEPYPHAVHPIPKTLHSDHIVIIGDAVHCIPPVLAQGANQAIEDAWVLARELQMAASVPLALAHYQAERRRKVSVVSYAARGPVLPIYAVGRFIPRRIPGVSERFCTWAWRMVVQSCSSTIPLFTKSR